MVFWLIQRAGALPARLPDGMEPLLKLMGEVVGYRNATHDKLAFAQAIVTALSPPPAPHDPSDDQWRFDRFVYLGNLVPVNVTRVEAVDVNGWSLSDKRNVHTRAGDMVQFLMGRMQEVMVAMEHAVEAEEAKVGRDAQE